MKRIINLKRGMAVLMVASLITAPFVPLSDIQAPVAQAETQTWKYGLNGALGFNENTYSTIEKSTTENSWREGSVTANGEIAFIESCDPDEDVFIFNNTKIVTDGTDFYETPDISSILDDQRKGAVIRLSNSDFPWISAVNKLSLIHIYLYAWKAGK